MVVGITIKIQKHRAVKILLVSGYVLALVFP